MRSDVKHLSKCGKESLYFCRTYKDSHCSKHYEGCPYRVRTITDKHRKNRIHPIAINLTELFARSLVCNFLNTAWCIDLARMTFGWEQVAKAKGYPDEFVQAKIREKIEKDKGIKIC